MCALCINMHVIGGEGSYKYLRKLIASVGKECNVICEEWINFKSLCINWQLKNVPGNIKNRVLIVIAPPKSQYI